MSPSVPDAIVGGAERIDERPVPQLDHGHRPDRVSVVSPATTMILDRGTGGCGTEDAAVLKAGGGDDVGDTLAELASQPCAEGDGESHLGRGHELRRNAVGCHLAEEPLIGPPVPLPAGGERGGELDHPPVEQR